MKITSMIVIGLFFVLSADPAGAQVASGTVDTARQVTLSGTVKSIQWGTPRSLVQLVVTDAQGKVTEWSLEGDTKIIYAQFDIPGQRKDPGNVSVVIRPLKDNTAGGVILSMSPLN